MYNNFLAPATKEDISHSMESNFPGNFRFNPHFFLLADVSEGIARFAVAQEAMQHLEQNLATFQKIFTNFNIPESEYQLLAGFDEDIIRSRLGYLNQIHIVLRSEPQDVDRFLLCLSSALKNFTAIIFTNKSTYRLPSAPKEFHEIVRANTRKTSYGISTLAQHADTGGSFNVGGPSGGNNGGDRPDDSTRKAKERERDPEDPSKPHDSNKEDSEPGPESPGPCSSSAELAFRVSADLLQNGVSFQSLQTRGALKIMVWSCSQFKFDCISLTVQQRTPESQDPSQFATCNIEFTGLHMANMCLSEENLAYHHFQLDIRIDALSEFTDTPDVRPLSTPQYNSEAKVSKGVKKAWNNLVSGSLTLLPPKATIGASGGRTGEESINTEKTVNVSRIMYRESSGIILWKFHLVDRFEEESGLALSPEKLPLAHILFGGDEAAPPSPPAHLNVEIFTYWSILSSRGSAWTGSKPRFSNLCKIISLNLSKDLQGSHLYLSNLLVQVDANPIITTVKSEVGYPGRAVVAEIKHTTNTPI